MTLIFTPDRVNFQIGQGCLVKRFDQWESKMSEILTNHKPDRVTFQSCKLVLTEQMTMIYHQHLQIFSLIQIFLLRQIFSPNQTETRKYILETVKSVKCLIIVTWVATENSGQFCHTTQYSFLFQVQFWDWLHDRIQDKDHDVFPNKGPAWSSHRGGAGEK